jgi:predicted negative regulator of RcsB-dependent stress response
LTEYLTEQEQVEILKNWVKQYSLVILAGVALAAIAISGWRYWQTRQANILYHASAVYDEMLTMRAQNNASATQIQSQKLFTHYPKTTYGQMAAFMLARNAVTVNDYPEAEKQLNWILKHSNIASFRQIARIRLARVLITEKKAEEAVKVLSKIEDKSFDGFTLEVKGDAYLAMNDTNKAREAYQAALTALPNAETVRPLLQMKYDNLTTANLS